MSLGLPVSRLISTQVTLAPPGAQYANLNSALLVGESTVIDTLTRLRLYATLNAVAADFGTTAPEYLAASEYFSQIPQPENVYIGRWCHVASQGVLVCGPLSAAQQVPGGNLTNAAAQFKVAVSGGAVTNVTANLTGQTNMNGVATAINAGLAAGNLAATVAWNGVYGYFEFTANVTGNTSSVSFLTAGTANDISGLLAGLSTSSGAYTVQGINAESLLTAVTIMDGLSTPWYGLNTDACPDRADSDIEAVSAYVAGSANPHIQLETTQEAAAIVPTATSDVGYVLSTGAKPIRTGGQYSSSSPYAAASLLARALIVNWQGNNTTITLMYKQEPGVTPETLNVVQAGSLDTKRYNYFANYNNATAIVENGWMFGPAFIDEIMGMDWLANQIQTNVYNVLYTSPTKVPQTDPGEHLLYTAIAAACSQGVTNGLLAPGIWNSAGFGALVQGSPLPGGLGYYIYQPPVALQPQNLRAARQSVIFQVAAKLAGAVHSVDILVNVNR